MKTFRKAVLFGLLFSVCAQTPASAQESVSWLQKIKNFFSGNPATVEQTQTIPEDMTDAQTKQVPAKKKVTADFSERAIGDRDAPLKINVFTSLTCPHCSGVHTQLLPYLREKYVDTNEAIIILNDFPLDERAMTASLVAHCLTGDSYFAFIDTLFENQMQWAVAPDVVEALVHFAKLAGLSEEETRACAADKDASKELTRQRNLSIMRYKIHATPTLILKSGRKTETITGAPSRADMEKAIEKMLNPNAAAAPAETEKEADAERPVSPEAE